MEKEECLPWLFLNWVYLICDQCSCFLNDYGMGFKTKGKGGKKKAMEQAILGWKGRVQNHWHVWVNNGAASNPLIQF